MEQTNKQIRHQTDASLENWREKEKTAIELLGIVGDLRFNKAIEILLFRRDVYDARPSTLLHDHLLASNYTDKPLEVGTTLAIVQAINNLDGLAPCIVDIGKIGLEWMEEGKGDIEEFVGGKLAGFVNVSPKNQAQKDVVLYGFGRIGRLAARRIISSTGRGEQLRLKAIVIRPKLQDLYEEALKRAALLREDSVHGDFPGSIEVNPNGKELIINGNRVQLIFAQKPQDIDYTEFGIHNAIVIDNTGVWRDREGLSQHLRPGVSQVMLTAPGKGDVPNIVYGVNHSDFEIDNEPVLSAASCTTNAIVPVLNVMESKYGIEKGHVETIHAYTNDQNLLDNFHKKQRRGRGAPINMVLTDTGAASAVAKVLPPLAGKLTGNAIRVPTPNVSIAILSLSLKEATTTEALNETLKDAALYGDLVEQIRYSTNTEFVSTNAIGMTSTSVVDAPSTIVSNDGKSAVVYLWYDNEFGYTCQVIRLAKHVARVRRYTYY